MATINGTQFNDSLHGTEDSDFIHGREGDDELRGRGGDDTLMGGEGNDTLAGDEFLEAPGDDLLIGGEGNDVLAWLSGNDTLIGGEGDDFFSLFMAGPSQHVVISGGEGVDSMEFIGGAPVTVHLGQGTLTSTFQGQPVSMSLQSIENFRAPIDSNVHVTGSAAANFIETGNGNDTLSGAEGRDTLWGSASDDLYILDAAPGEANADLILFEKYTLEVQGFDENDRIALENAVMPELGAEGDLAADDERFFAAAGATGGAEADDRVVYDTEAGRLYYDADGSGAGEAQLIAIVAELGHGLAASDLTIV
jgi:Ca2+-binding RTX toxin-like protein